MICFEGELTLDFLVITNYPVTMLLYPSTKSTIGYAAIKSMYE